MFLNGEELDVDPDTLSDGELAAAVVELHRDQARLAAVNARLVAAADARRVWADDDYQSTATWLADNPDVRRGARSAWPGGCGRCR